MYPGSVPRSSAIAQRKYCQSEHLAAKSWLSLPIKNQTYTQRGNNLRKPVRWPSEAVALGWRFSTASEGHRTKPQFVTAWSIKSIPMFPVSSRPRSCLAQQRGCDGSPDDCLTRLAGWGNSGPNPADFAWDVPAHGYLGHWAVLLKTYPGQLQPGIVANSAGLTVNQPLPPPGECFRQGGLPGQTDGVKGRAGGFALAMASRVPGHAVMECNRCVDYNAVRFPSCPTCHNIDRIARRTV